MKFNDSLDRVSKVIEEHGTPYDKEALLHVKAVLSEHWRLRDATDRLLENTRKMEQATYRR